MSQLSTVHVDGIVGYFNGSDTEATFGSFIPRKFFILIVIFCCEVIEGFVLQKNKRLKGVSSHLL